MKKNIQYLVVFCILFLSVLGVKAQAPSISYSTPTNVYSVGTIITSLTPTNTGGAVPATVYATVSTFAGSTASTAGTTNATGTAAKFSSPRWTTFDAAGNQYVADAANNEIRKITTIAQVALLAGSTTGVSGTTNSNGSAARFNGPYAITYDGTDLYVADFSNNEIRKVTTAGVVTLFAGSAAAASGTTNASGTSALFNQPAGIVYDPTNSVFYIADFGNNQIRKMTAAGVVTLFAGNASGTAGSTDGTGSAAFFSGPNGIAVDGSGNIYVADQNNNDIRKITPAGVVTTLAGSTTSGSADGTGAAASFLTPRGVCVDASGNLYITDSGNDLIRMVTQAGVVTTIAGSGTAAQTNGVGTAAAFNAARGIAVDPTTGNIFVCDYSDNVIRKIIGTGYSISPALPAGLSFDSTTGIISGNPTATSSATDYTITGFNVSGSSSTIVNIQCVRTVDWKSGSNSTAWNTAGNWSTGAVPGINEDVRIGVVAYTNNKQPTLSATTTVHSITFGTAKAGILTIANGRTLTISGNLTVNTGATGTLTSGTGLVDIAPAGIVNVTGTGILSLLSTLTFTLKSDATGSASIGQLTSGTISGAASSSINVERYFTGGSNIYRGYRLVSSPVYAATVSSNQVYNLDFIKASALVTGSTGTGGGFDKTGNPTLYLFREDQAVSNTTFTSGNFWGISKINNASTYNFFMNGGSTTFNIPVGNGFLFFFRGDRTTNLAAKYTTTTSAESVTFSTSGTLNTGQITVKDWYTPGSSNLGYTATAGNMTVRGYNLIGNPYPSNIDWDTFQTSSSTTGIYGVNIGTTVYQLDPVSKNYGAYINGNGGIGTNHASNIISSGQGFFVVATAASPQLIFNETAKTSSQATGLNLLMGKPVNYASSQYLRLQMSKDSISTDDILIRFNNTVKDQQYVANIDAPYKPGFGAVSLSSISSDNVDLAINVMPLPQQSEKIGLNVNVNADGVYKLNMKELIGLPKLFDIWLMDTYKNDSLDMRANKVYSFNISKSDPASFGSKRFVLVVRQNPAYAYRLLDFTATKVPNATQVQVVWKAENEQNYTHFTVERSTDNEKTFDVLSGQTSAGQSIYSTLDKSPVIGQNTYRLKQEDINNTISYSKAVNIFYSDLSNKITNNLLNVYPNPVAGNINLSITQKLAETASYSIKFMNSSGIMVKQVTSTQPSWQGTVSNLLPGTYLVQVTNTKNQSLVGQSKFVKL